MFRRLEEAETVKARALKKKEEEAFNAGMEMGFDNLKDACKNRFREVLCG